MGKIRIDLPEDPYEWFFLGAWHEPDLFPEWHIGHYLSIFNLDNMDAGYGPSYDFPSLSLAQSAAMHFIAFPNQICDCCIYCHGIWNARPRRYWRVDLNQPGYPYRRPTFISPYSPFPVQPPA